MTDRAESALHKLRGGVLPVPDERHEQERRERIGSRVLELQRELSEATQRRRRWGRGVLLAACVAGAGGLFVLVGREAPVASIAGAGEVRIVGGHASLREGERLAPLEPGQLELSGGSVLVTRADESAELRLSSETAVSLAPASEVGIAQQGPADGVEERVRLRSGSVALRVPKLGARRKVSVETRDALVEVHGTQFSVRVVERPPLAPFTEVDVREGRVLVRSGQESRFLGAGEHWSSGKAVPERVEPPPAPVPEPEPVVTPSPSARPSKARVLSPVAASELAAQNRLLEAAELAQKSGMPTLALQRLDALIARYPDADLAHNARVERFRILQATGRQNEAAEAARVYLARHPDGFARQEAEQLIQRSSERSEP